MERILKDLGRYFFPRAKRSKNCLAPEVNFLALALKNIGKLGKEIQVAHKKKKLEMGAMRRCSNSGAKGRCDSAAKIHPSPRPWACLDTR